MEEPAEHKTGRPAVQALMCQCYFEHWAMLRGEALGHWCYPEHWAAPQTFIDRTVQTFFAVMGRVQKVVGTTR